MEVALDYRCHSSGLVKRGKLLILSRGLVSHRLGQIWLHSHSCLELFILHL